MRHGIRMTICALLLASCIDTPYFAYNSDIPVEGWYARDTIVIPIQPTTPNTHEQDTHTIKVGIRNTHEYAYQSLYLLVETVEGEKILSRDTISFNISDIKGRNTGTGVAYRSHTTKTIRNQRFHPDSTHTLRISHIMRMDPIAGISNICVEVE